MYHATFRLKDQMLDLTIAGEEPWSLLEQAKKIRRALVPKLNETVERHERISEGNIELHIDLQP